MGKSAVLKDISANQRAAADPGISAWVAANAGAGKTRVLVDRVSRMLLGGVPPSKILCLTFTKAAASEMANRLFGKLGEWTTFDDKKLTAALRELLGRDVGARDLAAARRLFAAALETPGGLKIQTIHAFCESLLGRFPLEAGVSPHFSVMDERQSKERMAVARDVLFGQIESGRFPVLATALSQVAALVDETGFADVMGELLSHRARLVTLLRAAGDADGLVRQVYGALGLSGDQTRDTLLDAAAADGAFDELGLRRAAKALGTGSKSDQDRAVTLLAWLEDSSSRVRRLAGDYFSVFITKDGDPRKNLITKKAQDADPLALPALVAEQERLCALQEKLKSADVAASTSALIHLGAALIDTYEMEKDRASLLDYDDLILKVRDLLSARGVDWVLYKLDGGIDHILIDEAQDTSPEQWAVVTALSEEFFAGAGRPAGRSGERTVFAVGDEKQSIYSFQGADPRAFDRMRKHFQEKVLAATKRFLKVDLALSFRSSPAVLTAVDQVFASLAAREGLQADGRAPRHQAVRSGAAGLVELWPPLIPRTQDKPNPWDAPLDQIAADSPQARLAERIADKISMWIETEEELTSKGRPIRPGDILILVRRRTPFVDELVRRLKQRRVPVAGTDRMVLTEQIAVMDLMALAQFVLLPEDDLSLAAVLKSPFFCLSEEDLFDLAAGRKKTLWEELKRRRDKNPLFEKAAGELSALLDRADFMPPYEFFSHVLGRENGRRRLLSRLGPDAGDPLDEFLNRALEYERVEAPSLQGFLIWLAEAGTQVKRDLEQDRDQVRIMTVHGAKGLEAGIVFLPDTCGAPNNRNADKLRWPGLDPDLGEDVAGPVLLWPVKKNRETKLCASAGKIAEDLQMREYRRLLYVAMTRARDRLYVAGWETKRGRAQGCWYDLILAAMKDVGEEVVVNGADGEETLWRLATAQSDPQEGEPPSDLVPPFKGDLPSWMRAPAPPEPSPSRPLAPSQDWGDGPAVLSPLAPLTDLAGEKAAEDAVEGSFKRGRLIHRLLESLPDVPPFERDSLCQRFLSRPALGLGQEDISQITRETLNVLETEGFAEIFGPDGLSEVPIVGPVDGAGKTVISGRIDRLLVTADEVLIVDYKTNRPPPATASQVAEPYLRQMAAYRAALIKIYPEKTISCAILWTNLPALMPLDNDLLERYLP